jgi:dienelactone hydrolase
MQTSIHPYHHAGFALEGYLAHPDAIQTALPALLVVHDWSGCNAYAKQQAEYAASLGYVGFAVDMYGHGQVGETVAEKQALMAPLIADRAFLQERIQAALQTVMALDYVDLKRIAIVGFCFGGLCALDLARSGADIRGAISVHGLLHHAPNLASKRIHAKVLVLHGYDDPMVTPNDVNVFCQEMTEAGVDWQMHIFGQTQHAFTNPQAHDKSMGTVYNELSSSRARVYIDDFLADIFSHGA